MKRLASLAAVSVLLLLGTTVAPLAAPAKKPPVGRAAARRLARADWSTAQGGPDRRGRAQAPAIRRPSIRWTARVGILGWLNAPVISGARVFVGSSGERHNQSDALDGVHCLDLRTGSSRWFWHASTDVNSVTLYGSRILVTDDAGWIHTLEQETGKVIWERQLLDGKLYGSPVVIGDLAVLADSKGKLHGLATSTGETRWTSPLPGPVRGGVAYADSVFVTATERGIVCAFDSRGRERWQSPVEVGSESGSNPNPIYATPAIASGRVVIASAGQIFEQLPLTALSLADGARLWSVPQVGFDGFGSIRSTPAVGDSVVVVTAAYTDRILGLDARTGEIRWSTPTGTCMFIHWASPAIAGPTAYVPRADGVLYAVDVRSGALQWKLFLGDATRIGANSPNTPANSTDCAWFPRVGKPLFAPLAIASDGTLLVGSGEGNLYAIVEAGRGP